MEEFIKAFTIIIIVPIKIKSTQHHLSLFADDILLYFSDVLFSE